MGKCTKLAGDQIIFSPTVYVCIYIYIYIHAYIHTCIHTYIHAYTFTCVCVCVCVGGVCELFKPTVTSKQSHTLTAADRVMVLTATPNIAYRQHVKHEDDLDALLLTFWIESLVRLCKWVNLKVKHLIYTTYERFSYLCTLNCHRRMYLKGIDHQKVKILHHLLTLK